MRVEVVKGKRGWYGRRRNDSTGKVEARGPRAYDDFTDAMDMACYQSGARNDDFLWLDRFALLRELGIDNPRQYLRELGSL